MKLRHQRRQQVAAQGGAGAQMQLTAAEAGEGLQVALGGLLQGKDALGIRQQALPRSGEGDAAALSIKQWQAQAGFQLADLTGHSRLADKQAGGPRADAAGLGDGEKDLEVVQIHK